MKSTQISSMFTSLSEAEESGVCGGTSLEISKGDSVHKVIKIKGKPGKKGVKKQKVESSVKIVKTTKNVKALDSKLLDGLFDALEALDW
ncbi:MAG: hypothetical protein RMX96_28205 [Nostoc sp. ChiSLP02]|nr:hypothetical protein [Nostoc sp. DedSLP05]MDZ8097350.1 hypothetical protein [Nostoc sp. DedSLP01]MDZ8188723.1 hypothetical protein [Nostoc sp. ChiSLP02]